MVVAGFGVLALPITVIPGRLWPTVWSPLAAWAVLAIYFSDLPPWLRPAAACLFAAGTVAAVAPGRYQRQRLGGFIAAFCLVLGWWTLIFGVR